MKNLNKFIIALLISANIFLLYKMLPTSGSQARVHTASSSDYGHGWDEIRNEIRIDTLLMTSWMDYHAVNYDFRRPSIMFFFSKNNCQNCIELMIDYLNKFSSKRVEIYFVSVDLNGEEEKIPYLARYKHHERFYQLTKIALSDSSFQPALPIVTVVDTKRNILFWKTISPLPMLANDKLFLDRLEFIMNLVR